MRSGLNETYIEEEFAVSTCIDINAVMGLFFGNDCHFDIRSYDTIWGEGFEEIKSVLERLE